MLISSPSALLTARPTPPLARHFGRARIAGATSFLSGSAKDGVEPELFWQNPQPCGAAPFAPRRRGEVQQVRTKPMRNDVKFSIPLTPLPCATIPAIPSCPPSFSAQPQCAKLPPHRIARAVSGPCRWRDFPAPGPWSSPSMRASQSPGGCWQCAALNAPVDCSNRPGTPQRIFDSRPPNRKTQKGSVLPLREIQAENRDGRVTRLPPDESSLPSEPPFRSAIRCAKSRFASTQISISSNRFFGSWTSGSGSAAGSGC